MASSLVAQAFIFLIDACDETVSTAFDYKFLAVLLSVYYAKNQVLCVS